MTTRDRSSMFEPEAPGETPPAQFHDDVRIQRDTDTLVRREGSSGWEPVGPGSINGLLGDNDKIDSALLPSVESVVELGYAEAVADQSGLTGTPTDLTGLTITFNVTTRPVLVMGVVPYWVASAISTAAQYGIVDGAGTFKAYSNTFYSIAASGQMSGPMVVERIATPGTYTRKLQGFRLGGSGTVTMKAAATFKAFIRAAVM